MIILASSSPRRKELLEKYNIPFSIITYPTKEIFNMELPINDALIDVAYQKGLVVSNKHPDDIVISADTIVYCNQKIFGKPKDLKDAFLMLKKLSNTKHQVLTGVCIFHHHKIIKWVEETNVYFRELKEEEILDYINNESVLDKAGSYAIQEGASHFVSKIEGSYNNIVGLPVEKIVEILKTIEN